MKGDCHLPTLVLILIYNEYASWMVGDLVDELMHDFKDVLSAVVSARQKEREREVGYIRLKEGHDSDGAATFSASSGKLIGSFFTH